MNELANQPTFWQQVQWPVIIIALLGGHAFIMLVAMSFALAGPPLDIPEDYRKSVSGEQAAELSPPQVHQSVPNPR